MANEIIENWLAKRASLTPERVALANSHEKLTFKELNIEAKNMARKLAALNIKDGDHIAVLLKNDFNSIILIHALTYVGAIIVFLNTKLSPKELVFQVERAQAKMLICVADYQKLALEVNSDFHQQNRLKDKLEIVSMEELTALGKKDNSCLEEAEISLQKQIDLDKTHCLIFTSGTTGQAKGVVLSYGNHFWSAIGSILNLGLEIKDSWLLVLPVFHVSGLSILMRSLIYGIKVVVQENFDAKQVNNYILHEEVSHVSVVTIQLQKMLEDLKVRTYPSSLRCVLLGGGFVPQELLEESNKRNIPVFQSYGMTETASQIATLSPEYLTSKLGSAGKSLFPAQLKIMKNGQEVINEVGEVVVKGPSVTKAYYNDKESTEEAIKEGWLYTGDLAYLDEDGFLYIVDRRSDLIISGGENIYPAEIEKVLLGYPNVEEAGVTGLDDQRWGKVPIAFVKLRESSKINETLVAEKILSYCSNNLAKYKVPVEVIFVENIPRNASNKLMRNKLLQYYKRNDTN